jgi:uncharacterized protein
MSRIVFWIALAILIVFAVRSKLRSMSAPPPDQARQPDPKLGEGEPMACCAHCHVYFPASEAVRADGLDYCSPAHVRLPAQ